MHEANKKLTRSYYECFVNESIQWKKKGKKVGKLVVLTEEGWGVQALMKETSLTFDQLMGRAKAPIHPRADLWNFKYGETLVRLDSIDVNV